jgi:predicted nucleic acid-binding protein
MEILVRPLRLGVADSYQTAVDFLTFFPNLRTVSLDIHMAQEATSLRATFGLSPPDAMTVATGILTQVGHLVTNDERWKQKLAPIVDRIKVCYLNDFLPFS